MPTLTWTSTALEPWMSSSSGAGSESSEVLFVCTANVCRSRLAEVALADIVSKRGLEVAVSSAATMQELGGLAVPDDIRRLAGRLGAERLERPPRSLHAEDVEAADLVVCMARSHLREVVVTRPAALSKTFTLKEFVRRGHKIGSRRPTEPLDTWLDRLNEGRARSHLLGDSIEDDIADPYGGSPEEYRAALAEIEALVTELVELAWATGRLR